MQPGGASQPPLSTITISSPSTGSAINLSAGQTATSVTVNVAGTNSTGGTQTVRLFNNGVVGPQTTASQGNWTATLTAALPVGANTLTAVATDIAQSAQGTASSAAVTVGVQPTAPNSDPPAAVLTGADMSSSTVGTLAGTFGVSDSGAATYTIPIPVPPGVNGLQPNIGLAYNSHGGNGQLGVGWSLSGLSAVTRCPATVAQDGDKAGINYDNDTTNDHYCLDGQRLIPLTPPIAIWTDCASGLGSTADLRCGKPRTVEYRTEIESYARIISYEEDGFKLVGPTRFRVWSKSGQIMDYGGRWWIMTAGWTQQFNVAGSSQARVSVAKLWALDQVTDRAGNYMEIDYADRGIENNTAAPISIFNQPGEWLNVQYHGPGCSGSGPLGPRAPDSLPRPIGALPNVEFWPTAIRYYAAGARSAWCQDSSQRSHLVRFIHENIPGQTGTDNTGKTVATGDRFYDAGAGQSTLSKRLKAIETWIDVSGASVNPAVVPAGTRVNTYVLDYDTSANSISRSLLKSVTACDGANTVCLPPTKFDWEANTWASPTHQSSSTPLNLTGAFSNASVSGLTIALKQAGSDNSVRVADWNGDGKSDLIGWSPTNCTTNESEGGYSWTACDYQPQVCLSNVGGSGPAFTCGGLMKNGNSLSLLGGIPSETLVLDLNNDGKADLVAIAGGQATICISNGAYQCQNGSGQLFATADEWHPVYRGDFNGDGKIDVVIYTGQESYVTCLATGTGFNCLPEKSFTLGVSPCVTPATECEKFSDELVQTEVLVADLNGDGKADLIRYRGTGVSTREWKVCFSDYGPGRGDSFRCHDRFVTATTWQGGDQAVFDLNGDGVADIAAADNGQWSVCMSTGDGAFEFRNPGITWNGTAFVDATGTAIDYNASPRCRQWPGPTSSSNTKALYGDFNGDGRTDVATWNRNPNTWNVCLSTGTAFNCHDWSGGAVIGSGGNDPDLNQWVVAGDFNGDGKTDFIALPSPAGSAATLSLAVGPPVGDVINSIATGLGAITNISYAPLTETLPAGQTSVYTKGTVADIAIGELDIQSPMYVVKQVDASTGIGQCDFVTRANCVSTKYSYQGLKGAIDGRGLLGFASRTIVELANDAANKLTTRITYGNSLANWPLAGRPTQIVKTGANGIKVNQSDNVWVKRNSSTTTDNSRVLEVVLDRNTTQTWDLNGIQLPTLVTAGTVAVGGVASGLTYDQFGNPVDVAVSTLAAEGTYAKVTNNGYYAADIGNWLAGRLRRAQVTSKVPGGHTDPAAAGTISLTRTSAFTYQSVAGGDCGSAIPGVLCSETIEPDDLATLYQQTSYAYDQFGNRTTVTVATRSSSRASSMSYTSDGRFPLTLLNALGHGETRDYDRRFGGIKQVTGPNGLYVKTDYDTLGRKIRERAYDGSAQSLSDQTWHLYSPGGCGGGMTDEVYCQLRRVAGGNTAETYFDNLQRERRTRTHALANNTWAEATVGFDAAGRKVNTVAPVGTGTITTNWQYDPLGRLVSESTTAAAIAQNVTTTVYSGLATAVTHKRAAGDNLTTTRTNWGNGLPRSVTDALAGMTSHYYDPHGNVLKVSAPTGYIESFSYDLRSRKLAMNSPDAGNWTYGYNGFGELETQTDGRGWVTTVVRDILGRTTRRIENYGPAGTIDPPPMVTNWLFDTDASGSWCAVIGSPQATTKGLLCETRTGTAIGATPVVNVDTVQRTTYDAQARARTTTIALDNRTYGTTTVYDAYGRARALVYPSGYAVGYAFSPWNGQTTTMTDWNAGNDTAGATTLWSVATQNPDGSILAMNVGGLTTTRGYDALGRVSSLSTTNSVQGGTYSYDLLGNLLSRADGVNGQMSEIYTYDVLNRVVSVAGTTAKNYRYNAGGNLVCRSDRVGASGGCAQATTAVNVGYFAGTHRPNLVGGNNQGISYQVTGYDGNGNAEVINYFDPPCCTDVGQLERLTPPVSRVIAYTPFNLPRSIGSSTGNLAYRYDHNHRRIKEDSGVRGVTYSLGGYEEHIGMAGTVVPGGIVTEQRHFLNTPAGVIGIRIARNVQPVTPGGSVALPANQPASDTRYWHKDPLGSVVAITKTGGTVVGRYQFDVWGEREVKTSSIATGDPYEEERGYTGHAMMDEVALINMNGRIYDPTAGRFLQADPIVQAPGNGQSYNRYSYAMNNPLSLTDPSGLNWLDRFVTRGGAFIHASTGDFAGAWGIRQYAYKGAQNSYVRMAGAAVAAYFTFGAAAGWAANAGLSAGTANAIGGAAAGFASGGIQGGNIESAVWGAVTGAFGGYLSGGTSFGNPIEQASSMWGDIAAGNFGNFGQRLLYLSYYQGMAYAEASLLGHFNIDPRLFDVALMSMSIVGNEVLTTNPTDGAGNAQIAQVSSTGSRYVQNDVLGRRSEGRMILGYSNRGLAGIPFDTADFLLEAKGMPSATVRDWVTTDSSGLSVSGHSLGGVTVAYLVGNGLASHGYVFAPGAGIAQPPKVFATLSNGDAVNLFSLGRVFNPNGRTCSLPFLTHAMVAYNQGCR
ncbi:MAG: FG-GAP-like repeat-containing protein [Betaproteobacteria bacterium]